MGTKSATFPAFSSGVDARTEALLAERAHNVRSVNRFSR
jgi:hypothetical protein